MPTIQRKSRPGRRILGQSTISSAFQTTLSAEAVRALDLRPGMRLNQTVEGNRLVLEPMADLASLVGCLGQRKATASVEKINETAKAAMARAGLKGLRDHA